MLNVNGLNSYQKTEINFKSKQFARYKGHCILIKVSMHQQDITNIKMHLIINNQST